MKEMDTNAAYRPGDAPEPAMNTPVRTYKDRVFRMIFKEPAYALELYNAVNGTAYTDPGEIEIVTLEHSLYMGMKNDVALVLHDSMNLFEHQATKNPNLPLRDLFYVSREYSALTRNENLYGSSLVRIPEPRFLVFYNGKAPMPEKEVLRLSDAYIRPEKEGSYAPDEPNLELKVEVYNINKGFNTELMQKCPTLRDYMLFVDKTRRYQQDMPLEEAVEKAVEECIKEHILEDFFRKNKAEVIHMSIFEYDEERHMEQERKSSYAQGEQDGYNRGKQDGYNKGAQDGYNKGEQDGYSKGEQVNCIKVIVRKKDTLLTRELADILDVPTSFVEKVCALADQYPEASAEELAALLGE